MRNANCVLFCQRHADFGKDSCKQNDDARFAVLKREMKFRCSFVDGAQQKEMGLLIK